MSDSTGQSLAARPNLEQYKKQARELLQSIRSQQSSGLERLKSTAPHIDARVACLADAQFVVAREHGFDSWPKFKRHIELSTADLDARADAFVNAAIDNRLADAKRLLSEIPNLAQTNLYTAVAYGDIDTVRRIIDTSPALVNAVGGPVRRPPIAYLTWSRFIQEREAEILETARLLLNHGADPNILYMAGEWELPTLYGACGQLGHAGLAAILIDAGANVDDNESLYHSTEFRDHACTRLLLERGARINGTNALKHQLDVEDIDGLKLLLDYGADPNELNNEGMNALHWAIDRRRSAATIALLIDHGVDVNAALPDGLTPYRMAWRLGGGEVEALLRARGAEPILSPADELINAAAQGNAGTIRSVLSDYPDTVTSMTPHELGAIARFAQEGNTTAVALLLDNGFPIDARGEHKATPLHWAAWRGRPDTVQLLIDRGADVEVEGSDLGSTPLQWAIHASTNNPDTTTERTIAVIESLMNAGAVPRNLEMASVEARAYIDSRLNR